MFLLQMINKFLTANITKILLNVKNVKIKLYWVKIKKLVLNWIKRIIQVYLLKLMFFVKVMYLKQIVESAHQDIDFMMEFVRNVLRMCRTVISAITMTIMFAMYALQNITRIKINVFIMEKQMIIWTRIYLLKKIGNTLAISKLYFW